MTPRDITIEMQRVGAEPIWVAVSAMTIGINEIPGRQSQAVILQWAEDLGIRDIYTNDDTAWCALWFWRLMLACQLPVLTPRDRYDLLRARKVEDYGQPLTSDVYGMIGVFDRPAGAHVGIILAQSGDSYVVRGGNQGNAVSQVPITKSRCVARRWPLNQPMPAAGLLELTGLNLTVSENEA